MDNNAIACAGLWRAQHLADRACSTGHIEVPVVQLQQALTHLKGNVSEDVGALAGLAAIHDPQLDGDTPQYPILRQQP